MGPFCGPLVGGPMDFLLLRASGLVGNIVAAVGTSATKLGSGGSIQMLMAFAGGHPLKPGAGAHIVC